ncbi:probable G-protein coupled receptor No18 [Patiria miniata]|uniref:G-protein coupled receptors family 1 profile domain-containing protein n=1 Tax=Patiria miniata TaxID=46514 RepID=A0A913ZRH5_PATMI|nr:probable G-protein coupled receptor No18 [Patiria miniata]
MSSSNDSDGIVPLPTIQGAPLEASLLSIASVLTVFGNLGTLAAFWVDRSLRQKPSNLFLVSLSAADFLMGLFVLPLRAMETALGYWLLGEVPCMFLTFFANIALTVAIYMITAISVDRFLLVSKDYSRYLAIVSLKSVRITILSLWGLVILSTIVEMILWGTDALPPPFPVNFYFACLPPVKLNQPFLMGIFVFGFFIPLTIMTVCSLGFMLHLRKRLKGKIHAAGEFSTAVSDTSGTARRTAWTTVASSAPTRGTVVATHGLAPPEQPVNDGASTASGVEGNGTETRETRRRTVLRNRYLKPAITMAALLAVFVACTLPYLLIAGIISPICPTCYTYQTRVHIANLMFANSCINPILYAATQSKIRDFYRTHVFRICRRR